MKKFKEMFAKLKQVDIYKNKRLFYIVPLFVILVMLICGMCYQLSNTKQYFANIGIDFQGGTILTIEFKDADANSEKYDQNLKVISDVLEEQGISISRDQKSGESTIIVQYVNFKKGEGANDAKEMNLINQDIKDTLRQKSADGEISTILTINDTTIGNTSSKNLLKTAAIAVAVALACMLLYIIIRFDLYSALATIVALLHDLIIMMSLSVIFYVEIGDSIVAALITIVAYSINNTIVVFDKIRSNVKPYKQSKTSYDVKDIVNKSIFGTMTRTIYTTFTTLVVMIILVAIGVASIRTFGLPIIFGLLAGFYSSVFIAAPLWADFKSIGAKIGQNRKNRKYKKSHAK